MPFLSVIFARFPELKDSSITSFKAEIIVSKQRHGPTGNIQIQFQAQFTRFLDLIQNNENTSR